MRHSQVIAAFLLMASAVDSVKVLSAKEHSALRKAMEPSRFGEAVDKTKILNKLFAKATFVSGRKLEEGDDSWGNFGFDISQYSVKYAGCSVVQTYSDDLAEDEDADTVLEGQKFVVFRLCPTQSCNKYSVTGCTEGYGEYLIDMGDYLGAVSEFYQEKSARYCEYCAPCYQGSGGGLDDADGADGAADGADGAADGADGAADDADAADGGETCDESVCADSTTLCVKEEEELDVHDFFDCAAIEGDDNSEYFLAPHCSSDKFTVTLGVYTDDECATGLSDKSLSYVLGYNIDTSILSTYFPKECTSCLESDNQYDNGEGDADDGDEIVELCENLYQASAKCNKGLSSYNAYSYQSSNQAEQEDTVCNYIETILAGTYNEDGEIVIDNDWYFNTTNWRSASEYLNQVSNAKKYAVDNLEPWQIALLAVIPFACLVLWISACCLHSSLRRRNIPWKPRRTRDMTMDDISRQNSGIVLGRSYSGGKTTPLI